MEVLPFVNPVVRSRTSHTRVIDPDLIEVYAERLATAGLVVFEERIQLHPLTSHVSPTSPIACSRPWGDIDRELAEEMICGECGCVGMEYRARPQPHARCRLCGEREKL